MSRADDPELRALANQLVTAQTMLDRVRNPKDRAKVLARMAKIRKKMEWVRIKPVRPKTRFRLVK